MDASTLQNPGCCNNWNWSQHLHGILSGLEVCRGESARSELSRYPLSSREVLGRVVRDIFVAFREPRSLTQHLPDQR